MRGTPDATAPGMIFHRPDPAQVRVGLGAIKFLATRANGSLGEAERDMVDSVQELFGTAHDVDALPALGPDEVAAQVSDPHLRHQLVCALIVASLIDGEATTLEADTVDAFARALGVEEKAVANLRQVARHEHLSLRIDVVRRFWAIEKLRERVHHEGVGAIWRLLRGLAGKHEDPMTAASFQAMRDLPDGTLGREYLRYLDERGWPLPGERGAQNDIIVYHDMAHVLGGYGTDPGGEIEIACFTAGFRRQDPFNMVLFVLLQFHAGVRMTPGAPAERGFFRIEKALAAIERGAAMNVDLSSGWEYRDVIGVPVEELRRRYNILPAR
jgi:hypothetical protein